MNLTGRPVTLFVLLAAATLIVTGCGKSRPPEATLSDSDIVGSWLEVPRTEAATARRVKTVEEQKFLRHVTINADKTFAFS